MLGQTEMYESIIELVRDGGVTLIVIFVLTLLGIFTYKMVLAPALEQLTEISANFRSTSEHNQNAAETSRELHESQNGTIQMLRLLQEEQQKHIREHAANIVRMQSLTERMERATK